MVVIYRTASGRTIYRQAPDNVGDTATLAAGDANLALLTNDPIQSVDVQNLTLEQYDAIADANPTWIELVPAIEPDDTSIDNP